MKTSEIKNNKSIIALVAIMVVILIALVFTQKNSADKCKEDNCSNSRLENESYCYEHTKNYSYFTSDIFEDYNHTTASDISNYSKTFTTTTTTEKYTYTRKPKPNTTFYDEYNVYEYHNEEDFYYDNYYDFFDYEDAADYYNEAWDLID